MNQSGVEKVLRGVLISSLSGTLSCAIVCAMGGVCAFGVSHSWAKPPEKISDAGEELAAGYAQALQTLKAEVAKSLPKIDDSKKAALTKAREAVRVATEEINKAKQNLGQIQQAKGLVEHAKGKWIGGAEKGLAAAQKALQQAKTPDQTQAAQAELAKWQANKEEGIKALQERQAAWDKLKAQEPLLRQAHQAAEAALTKAQAEEIAVTQTVLADVRSLLSGEKLDATLVKAVVLTQSTPQGLAQFATQGQQHKALVEQLLSNPQLMQDMLAAGGAVDGQYGSAMQILAAINKASPASREGVLRRLAIAVSIAHAKPIAQRNAAAETQAPTIVDPVERYKHYEKAYLAGELDPAFPKLATWEYCYVVDSQAPDHILTWGRQMLKNYRPDHVTNPQYGWRYSGLVRSDVAYRHSDQYTDIDSLGFFQNICKNGGICGRRAFFGRFIVQAFGLPARPFTQRGHAALVRWTPTGWVVNLGASWPHGWFPEQSGPEFLMYTQARQFPQDYQRVLRAEWIATVLGENSPPGKKPSAKSAAPGFWKQIAIFEKQQIVAAAKPTEPAALGTEIAEANEAAEIRAAAVDKTVASESDKAILTTPNGGITIPAAACTGGNHIVKSFLGGSQMIGGTKPITCVVTVGQAGRYALTARVVTVHGQTTLPLTVTKTKAPNDLAIPYTLGSWQTTAPVEVTLTAGENTLTLAAPGMGFALKDLTLTPVKSSAGR